MLAAQKVERVEVKGCTPNKPIFFKFNLFTLSCSKSTDCLITHSLKSGKVVQLTQPLKNYLGMWRTVTQHASVPSNTSLTRIVTFQWTSSINIVHNTEYFHMRAMHSLPPPISHNFQFKSQISWNLGQEGNKNTAATPFQKHCIICQKLGRRTLKMWTG